LLMVESVSLQMSDFLRHTCAVMEAGTIQQPDSTLDERPENRPSPNTFTALDTTCLVSRAVKVLGDGLFSGLSSRVLSGCWIVPASITTRQVCRKKSLICSETLSTISNGNPLSDLSKSPSHGLFSGLSSRVLSGCWIVPASITAFRDDSLLPLDWQFKANPMAIASHRGMLLWRQGQSNSRTAPSTKGLSRVKSSESVG
jgi:hypothetical protein